MASSAAVTDSGTSVPKASIQRAPGNDLDYTLSGFELDDLFQGSRKLGTIQKEIAVEFLRRSEQMQLERIQCIVDGALLGAEQVQDVRLDLLEKGPEVSTTVVIAELFLGLLLDSSIPGRMMKWFANSACKGLVARTRLLKIRARRDWIEGNIEEYNFFKEFVESKALEDFITEEISGDKYLAFAKAVRNVGEAASNSDIQKDVTAVGKAALKAGSKSFETKALIVDGDTPGVSLTNSVLEFVSINRLLIQFQYQRMETFVRLGLMTCDQARVFLKLAEFEPLQSPLKTIRDRCKVLFEALVWASLYGYDKKIRRFHPQTMVVNPERLEGVDNRLARYWVRRFGPDIKQWINGMGDQNRRNEGLDPISEWEKLPYSKQLNQIETYFEKLLSDLPQSFEDAKAWASSFSQ